MAHETQSPFDWDDFFDWLEAQNVKEGQEAYEVPNSGFRSYHPTDVGQGGFGEEGLYGFQGQPTPAQIEAAREQQRQQNVNVLNDPTSPVNQDPWGYNTPGFNPDAGQDPFEAGAPDGGTTTGTSPTTTTGGGGVADEDSGTGGGGGTDEDDGFWDVVTSPGFGILVSAGVGLLGVYQQAKGTREASEAATDVSLKAIEEQGRIAQETLDKVINFASEQADIAREDLAPWREAGSDALDSIRTGYEEGWLETPAYQKFQYGNFDPRTYQSDFTPEEFKGQPFEEEYKRDPFDFEESPGYQFRLAEGQKAITRQGAAGGFLKSGAYDKAIGRFSQDLASEEYQSAFDRYMREEGIDYRDFVTGYDINRGNEADRFRNFVFNQDVERQKDVTDYSRFSYDEDKRREDFYANRGLAYTDYTNQYNAERSRIDNEFARRYDIANLGLSAAGTGVNAAATAGATATGAIRDYGITSGNLAGSTGNVLAQNYFNQANASPWAGYATVANRGISNWLVQDYLNDGRN